ncbi:hypothetical protein HHI36_019171 [Cryptolaemus montrouzieri]|uniref:EF-hand domain-containing protein n=1 Tax=Cryptolaemus montrouzieri TaxID=559131 RepID=A0ABD2P2B8_9CUCU
MSDIEVAGEDAEKENENEEEYSIEFSEEVTIDEINRNKAKALFERMLKIPKISSKELIRKVLTREPLFKNIYQSDSFTDLLPDENAEKTASILVSGFGLKNLQQLQEALEAEAIVKSKKTEAEQFPCICSEDTSEKSEPILPPIPPKYSIEERVKYLLQLEKYVEVEGEMLSLPSIPVQGEAPSEIPVEPEPRSAMERAKKYLKVHKIFQFFQFLMSHLLSAVPEDPINYLMELLDRVLLYRTGLLGPPLLYEKNHIEQLFHLMDRFGQGYVDLQQYKTAMETLGICSYNNRPMLNLHSMVSKEVFIEEIFSAELTMFNDLIRNRVECACDLAAPPPTIIDMDLKAQSTTSGDDSAGTMEFNPVVSVTKFWEKHSDKQPKVYKGKFWSEFTREAQRRESERRESEKE